MHLCLCPVSKFNNCRCVPAPSVPAPITGPNCRCVPAPNVPAPNAMCNMEFVPRQPNQVYCSRQHKIKSKGVRIRQERAKQGLCERCGGPMTNKDSGKRNCYCDACARYYSGRAKR